MARFEQPQDPLFARINASIGFDRRLWPQDIEGSRAHAAGLEGAGVITAEELAELERGLDLVAAELERSEFTFAPDDEDIHMAVERRLTELIGPLGGKLHTGRSRNDQVATDLALYVRDRATRAGELVTALMTRLLALAEAHRDWRMPGYTHLQRAQPVYLGHHLLAYFWMLERDAIRFDFARRSTMAMPLGSGALAGLNWEFDREATADRLGFAAPIAELDRRGLEPRLRARLPERGEHVRHAPVTTGIRDRDLVEPRSSASASPPTSSPRDRA